MMRTPSRPAGAPAGRSARAVLALAVAAQVAWCAAGIGYSSLSAFSVELARDAFAGLARPDWSFVYDGSGEDLLGLMLTTVSIAALGTAIAAVLAAPLALVSARTMWGGGLVPRAGKLACNVLRAFPEIIYAIIFVKVVGPGPFAGALAIGVHQIGMLGKLYTEQVEAMDETPVEAMRAAGANFWQVLFYARIPQLASIFASLALNHFEIAVRSAATLGLVGAGGIGAPLVFAIQARNWPMVSIILLGVVATVLAVDALGGFIRRRLR